MKTLSPNTAAAVAAPATKPGYLVQLDLSSTLRYSTRGTVTWNSSTWTAADVTVSGMALDTSEPSATALLVFSAGHGMASIVRSNTVPGAAVKVWKYYGDTNPSLTDPVAVFDGIGDGVQINDAGEVKIALAQAGGITLWVPRTYMTPANGFNSLPKDGQLMEFNGEQVRLSPEGF